jgi:phosphate transport system substrate-binding protein
MLHRLARIVLLALSMSCSKQVASNQHDAGVERILVAGSTAMLPLLTDAANDFMRRHPKTAIEVQGGGSQEGLNRVSRGDVSIGASDIYAEERIATKLEDHRVAISGFAAMANRGGFNEDIRSLSLAQLKGIFTGRIRDWAELGGKSQAITLINRSRASGTRVAFAQIVLGSDEFATGPELESSALVLTSLEQTEGAISYLAFAYKRDSIKVFAVDGVSASNNNVVNGSYPIWSYEHLYTRGPARGTSKLFIDYMLSRKVQSELLERNGFAPAVNRGGH